MTILVVGATGATGRLVVEQLIDRGEDVKVIVRSRERLSEKILSYDKLSVTAVDDILRIPKGKMAEYLEGCDAVISCLGHNLTLKGIFGPPYRLVTDVTRLICTACKEKKSGKAIRFILMNTTGNRNRNLEESVTMAEKWILGVIGLLVPPQRDNIEAAEYLRSEIGQDHPLVEWVAVRPDTLINMNTVTGYTVYPSPVRSAIFNPGKTSRINVAHFMSELLSNDELWQKWKGQMPVLYNDDSMK